MKTIHVVTVINTTFPVTDKVIYTFIYYYLKENRPYIQEKMKFRYGNLAETGRGGKGKGKEGNQSHTLCFPNLGSYAKVPCGTSAPKSEIPRTFCSVNV